jgi:hypothetical protein
MPTALLPVELRDGSAIVLRDNALLEVETGSVPPPDGGLTEARVVQIVKATIREIFAAAAGPSAGRELTANAR